MKTSLSLIILLTGAMRFVHAADLEIENAQVTIPYTELKELLDAARLAELEKQKSKPPVEAVLTSAIYHLDFSKDVPGLTVDFVAGTFTDAWHSVPLFGGDPHLENFEGANIQATVSQIQQAKSEEDFNLGIIIVNVNS